MLEPSRWKALKWLNSRYIFYGRVVGLASLFIVANDFSDRHRFIATAGVGCNNPSSIFLTFGELSLAPPPCPYIPHPNGDRFEAGGQI